MNGHLFLATSAPGSTFSAGPGRIFVRYPVRRGTLINLVGLTRTDTWVVEGWSNRVAMTDWLAKYQGWHRDVTTAIAATDDVSIIAWGLFARDPLPTIVEGRVALMGDAAHPVLPFMGQGPAMAIKDGVMLDRVFAEVTTLAEALGCMKRSASRAQTLSSISRHWVPTGSSSKSRKPD